MKLLRIKVDRCGPSYVIVSEAGRGVFVVWQISDQMFARIDNCYDPVMVAAYVRRLGSIIPKDYKVDVDRWTSNEIRWRLPRLYDAYVQDLRLVRTRGYASGVYTVAPSVTTTFPDVFWKWKVPEPREKSLDVLWRWVTTARDFLWANRGNFRYDDSTRGYVLKGPDRYDPSNPPSLPEELRWEKEPPVVGPENANPAAKDRIGGEER